MKKTGVNIGQFIVSAATLALLCFLPFAGFNFGFITVLKSSLLSMAIHINNILLLLFLVLILEMLFSFSDKKQYGLYMGAIGLALGVAVAALLSEIVTGGNYGWIVNNISVIYNSLPNSVKSLLPVEITRADVDTWKQIVMSFYKGCIGMWIYFGSQVIYIVCALSQPREGSVKSDDDPQPVTF